MSPRVRRRAVDLVPCAGPGCTRMARRAFTFDGGHRMPAGFCCTSCATAWRAAKSQRALESEGVAQKGSAPMGSRLSTPTRSQEEH